MVNCGDNIKHRKPPLGRGIIPNGPHLTVIVETYGDFIH
jgi:hypothetical protein